MKVCIAFKIDNIYVLWTKKSENELYRVNFRSEEIVVILEIYSYFKELFKEKQIEYSLLEYQDWDYKIKLESGS